MNCHSHGQCVILPDDTASCVCYGDGRYAHDVSLGADGYCALESCGEVNGQPLTCRNGGSCV